MRNLAPLAAITAAISVLVPIGVGPNNVASSSVPGLHVAAASVEGATFQASRPCRLIDSRIRQRRLAPGETRTIDPHTVWGSNCSIPADESVKALAVTITVVNADSRGYLTAWAAGAPQPATSNINFQPAGVRATGAILNVDSVQQFQVYSPVGLDFIIDVTGEFRTPSSLSNGGQPPSAGRFVPVTPTRVFDSRDELIRLEPGTTSVVERPSNVPSHASALVINTTATNAVGRGFVTAWQYQPQFPRPNVSILNTDSAGQTRASTGIVPIENGKMAVYNSAAVAVIIDVTGYITGDEGFGQPSVVDGGLFVSVTPTRVYDSRDFSRRLARDRFYVATPVPEDATGLIGTLTMVRPDGRGYVTVWPADVEQPTASNVNSSTSGLVDPNLLISGVSESSVGVYTSVGTDLIIDLSGYFTG